MMNFYDSFTRDLLLEGVKPPTDHSISVGNTIEITENGDTSSYRITEIVIPYEVNKFAMGRNLSAPRPSRVYLQQLPGIQN